MHASTLPKTLVSICLLTLLPACGGDDPASATPPEAGSNAPNPTPIPDLPTGPAWERVYFSDLLPEPPAACVHPEIFRVRKDGSWDWGFCADEESGAVTPDELIEIDRRVRAVNDAGIGDEVCLELSYEGRRILEIRFPPGLDERVRDLGRRGSCFRGDAARINELEAYIDGLRIKYAGFRTAD